MTDSEERFRELQQERRRLTEALARTAEYSAAVHEQAARVHEDLGDAALLSPQQLRDHAERDRALAAEERERLREHPGLT